MTTIDKKQQAIFPDFPREEQMVDEKGNMTSPYRLYFQQLTMALQTNLKPEGFVVPPKPTTDITQLVGDASIGNIIVDSTTNDLKYNKNGTWRVVQLV